jgi:hypothetical protein
VKKTVVVATNTIILSTGNHLMNKHFMNTYLTNEPTNEPLLHASASRPENDQLRGEVHELAEAAFHRHLISGHGDSEYPDEYQIVHQGKPKHFPLSRARAFLAKLIQRSP